MKLSISNIAWPAEYDDEMYNFLSVNNFQGLEIAPTRIFPEEPYENLNRGKVFARKLEEKYNIKISSMQSIWYGIAESVFGPAGARQKLIDYTKKAVDFACGINCPNLVFGCPKNRAVPTGMPPEIYLPVIYGFFNQIGDYAADCGTCIAIEPNPPIYNTNFINTTAEAAELCRGLNNPGIKINADTGTVIYNNEDIKILTENIDLINHIHISEPGLIPIEKRTLHKDLRDGLKSSGYNKYISVEMGNPGNIDLVKTVIAYIKEIFI